MGALVYLKTKLSTAASSFSLARARNKAIPHVLPKYVQEWQTLLLAIPMNWQIYGHPRQRPFPGMTVFVMPSVFNSTPVRCFKKFKCLGDVLDSVTPITICHIEVPSFGRFCNLAQILI